MLKLIAVTSDEQIGKVAELAHNIWNQHFPAIIGQDQVDYMVERFQSDTAIREQILAGYRYYLLRVVDFDAGYLALVERPERQYLQISKLYLLQEWRGKGLAREVVQCVIEMAATLKLPRLYLTVNKYNHASISAYLKLGFEKKAEIVTDIGNGFVMDDYEMEKQLS